VRYAFNAAAGRYDWVETGPAAVDAERQLSEANICGLDDGSWLIAARTGRDGGKTAWWRTRSLFADGLGAMTLGEPATYGPRTMFRCPDGVVRIFSGSIKESPYGEKRNPLFGWDVDPDTFAVSNRRTIFDFYAQGLYAPAARELEGSQGPFAGFTMLGPWEGRKQILTHRVLKGAAYAASHPLTGREAAMFGSYSSTLVYSKTPPPQWRFAEQDRR